MPRRKSLTSQLYHLTIRVLNPNVGPVSCEHRQSSGYPAMNDVSRELRGTFGMREQKRFAIRRIQDR
ncbi:MAG: hypothetical protein ABSA65_15525 [Acidimicrobiales bacterium]|jgi:hypothetical protein